MCLKKQHSKRPPTQVDGLFGRGGIIGLGETQEKQWFAGSGQALLQEKSKLWANAIK